MPKGYSDKELAQLAAYSPRKTTNAVEKPTVPEKIYELRQTGVVHPNSIFSAKKGNSVSILEEKLDGIRLQHVQEVTNPDVELCIGLDFGTSCTKVVVGDKALGKAYAIPFVDRGGLDAYLLPSRVWEFNDIYSLSHGGRPHRDLKLRLLGENYEATDFEHAAVFLGLVIRLVRGWILSQSQYKKVGIAWKLNLGLPAASYANRDLDSVVSDRFDEYLL